MFSRDDASAPDHGAQPGATWRAGENGAAAGLARHESVCVVGPAAPYEIGGEVVPIGGSRERSVELEQHREPACPFRKRIFRRATLSRGKCEVRQLVIEHSVRAGVRYGTDCREPPSSRPLGQPPARRAENMQGAGAIRKERDGLLRSGNGTRAESLQGSPPLFPARAGGRRRLRGAAVHALTAS